MEQLQAGGALQTIQVFSPSAQAEAAGAAAGGAAAAASRSQHIEAKVMAAAAALRRVKESPEVDEIPSPRRPLSRKSGRLGQVLFCCFPISYSGPLLLFAINHLCLFSFKFLRFYLCTIFVICLG